MKKLDTQTKIAISDGIRDGLIIGLLLAAVVLLIFR